MHPLNDVDASSILPHPCLVPGIFVNFLVGGGVLQMQNGRSGGLVVQTMRYVFSVLCVLTRVVFAGGRGVCPGGQWSQ